MSIADRRLMISCRHALSFKIASGRWQRGRTIRRPCSPAALGSSAQLMPPGPSPLLRSFSPARNARTRHNSPRSFPSPGSEVILGSPYRRSESDRRRNTVSSAARHPEETSQKGTATLPMGSTTNVAVPRLLPRTPRQRGASRTAVQSPAAHCQWAGAASRLRLEAARAVGNAKPAQSLLSVAVTAGYVRQVQKLKPRGGSQMDRNQSAKTCWVGGIPDAVADIKLLTRAFSVQCGAVVAVQVRRKESTEESNMSWAFVSFLDEAGKYAALQNRVTVQGSDGGPVVLKVEAANVDQITDGEMRKQWERQKHKLF
eukprot:SAG22_NODE_449_length_10399_cov_43.159515_6_plen_314_part_00